MAYVITDTCTEDEHCIETCPVNCIHSTKDEADFATVPQLYVNPAECIDLRGRSPPSAQPALCLLWMDYRVNCSPSSKRTPPSTTTFSSPLPKSAPPPTGALPDSMPFRTPASQSAYQPADCPIKEGKTEKLLA